MQRNSSQFSPESATSVQTALNPLAPTDLSAEIKLKEKQTIIITLIIKLLIKSRIAFLIL